MKKQTNKQAICFTTKHMKMNCCSRSKAVNCMHGLILFFKIKLKVESLARQRKEKKIKIKKKKRKMAQAAKEILPAPM